MTEESHDHMPAPLAPVNEAFGDPLVQQAWALRVAFKTAAAVGVLALGYSVAGSTGLLPGVVLITGYLAFSRKNGEQNRSPSP